MVAWAADDGSFEVGPFPGNGGVQVNVLDADRTVNPHGWLRETGTKVLDTRVVKAKGGVLEPLDIDLN